MKKVWSFLRHFLLVVAVIVILWLVWCDGWNDGLTYGVDYMLDHSYGVEDVIKIDF